MWVPDHIPADGSGSPTRAHLISESTHSSSNRTKCTIHPWHRIYEETSQSSWKCILWKSYVWILFLHQNKLILICYDISEQDLQSYQFRNSPYQSNINSAKIEGKYNLFWCLRERIVKLLMLLENIMRAMTKGNH